MCLDIGTKPPKKHHTIPADVFPNDIESLLLIPVKQKNFFFGKTFKITTSFQQDINTKIVAQILPYKFAFISLNLTVFELIDLNLIKSQNGSQVELPVIARIMPKSEIERRKHLGEKTIQLGKNVKKVKTV